MKRFLKLLSRNQTAMVSCNCTWLLQCWFLCLSLLWGCGACTCVEDKGVSQRFVTVHTNPACVTTDMNGKWTGRGNLAGGGGVVSSSHVTSLLFLPFLAVCIFSHWFFIMEFLLAPPLAFTFLMISPFNWPRVFPGYERNGDACPKITIKSPKETSLEHGPGIHVDISTCKTLSNTFKAGTHQATSCSNMSWWHVTAKLLRVYWRIFVKIFVTATEFCRSNMLPKIKSDRICETCCGDKILFQRQIFSQNFSSTHEAICCCNLSQTVPTFFVQTVALPP